MHNVPTWDHRDPAKFRSKAASDLLERYNTIHFIDTKIESIRTTQHARFQATDKDGRIWIRRKLVLASGVADIAPDIKGYEECWANGMCVRI
jgi:gliotoxin/aspirochlorine biosynthesis thioredoxin reductase